MNNYTISIKNVNYKLKFIDLVRNITLINKFSSVRLINPAFN